MNLYLSIAVESFLSTLWPLSAELTAEAMQRFGGYDMTQASAYWVAGMVLAGMVLWLIGRLSVWYLVQKRGQRRVAELAGNAGFFAKPMGLVAMALLWLPMGFMIALIAGFVQVPLWRLMLCSSAGATLYAATMFFNVA